MLGKVDLLATSKRKGVSSNEENFGLVLRLDLVRILPPRQPRLFSAIATSTSSIVLVLFGNLSSFVSYVMGRFSILVLFGDFLHSLAVLARIIDRPPRLPRSIVVFVDLA